MIRLIEELTFNAWPALQTISYDGWLLRFADGFTRRANSVNPVYESHLDLDEKIDYCEQVYTQRGQNTVFKITPIAQPDHLDTALDKREYAIEALTSVQVLDSLAAPDAPAHDAVTIEGALTEAWSSAFFALSDRGEGHAPTMQRMLANLIPAVAFIALRRDEKPVSVGLGVLERGYLGIYDIVTATEHRNQGLGKKLMLNLLRWGQIKGATHAYLQVMLNNEPALHLYKKLGFREVYRYWYRVKVPPQT